MKETRTEHPCSDVWGSQCPKLAFCPKLSDRRTRSTSADFEPAALLSSSRHLILSRLVPDLPPSPPCMLSLQLPPPTTTNRVAKKWFCRFLFQYNFSSVQRRGFFCAIVGALRAIVGHLRLHTVVAEVVARAGCLQIAGALVASASFPHNTQAEHI